MRQEPSLKMCYALTSTVALLVIGLSACSSGSKGASATTPASQASGATTGNGQVAPTKTVHFESINLLTGAVAGPGIYADNGEHLAANQVNAAGGLKDACGNVYKVDLSSEDFNNSKEQAISLFRQSASNKSILGVLGPSSSVGFVPLVPVAGSLKISVITEGSAATIAQWNDYAYRPNITPPEGTPVLMKQLVSKLGIKRVAVLYDQANDGNASDAQLIKTLASSIGYDVVAFEAFRTGDTDQRSQLTAIKAAKPDLIVMDSIGSDLARSINEASDLGLGDVPRSTMGDQFDDASTWKLTNGKVKGGYSYTAAGVLGTSDALTSFRADYQKAYGQAPNVFSLYGYDNMNLYLDAVKRSCTNTDRVKFNSALRTTNGFHGLAGNVTFKSGTGENQDPSVVVIQATGPAVSEVAKF